MKRSGCGADHSSCSELKNEWKLFSNSPLRLHGLYGNSSSLLLLPRQTNMYRSICVEIKETQNLHSAVTKLCNVAGWVASCRSQNTNCLSLTKSNEDRNKGPHNLMLSGALTKLSLLRVVINQNELETRKCRSF